MKNILCILLATLLLSCNQEKKTISPDSVYNIDSKWETQNGDQLQLKDLEGKVLVTAMIFTSCKTACPRLTAEMRTISQKAGITDPDKIRYVLISIDPETDTPAVMKDYLAANGFTGKEWLFLRGNEENTRALANVMAVKYKKITPIEFSHSNIVSVYSKEGILAYQKEGLDSDIDQMVEAVKNQIKL